MEARNVDTLNNQVKGNLIQNSEGRHAQFLGTRKANAEQNPKKKRNNVLKSLDWNTLDAPKSSHYNIVPSILVKLCRNNLVASDHIMGQDAIKTQNAALRMDTDWFLVMYCRNQFYSAITKPGILATVIINQDIEENEGQR